MDSKSWGLSLLNPEGVRECAACKRSFGFNDIRLDDGPQGDSAVSYPRDSLWAESVCSRTCLVRVLEAAKKKMELAEERRRVTHIVDLLQKAGVPKEHLRFQLSSFDQSITPSQKKLLQFVSKCAYPFAKPVLVIGPAGTGKTHLAVALLREIILRGHCLNPLFITGIELMSQLRLANSAMSEVSPDEIIARCTQDRFVVFDDIGVEKATDYVLQSWYQIIDTRYSRGFSTLYTSNLTQPQCEEKFGSRLTSRLFSGKVFEIDGTDMRIAMGERV
jgi:DNA replication protein DnaC